jgi:hypothetical protein
VGNFGNLIQGVDEAYEFSDYFMAYGKNSHSVTNFLVNTNELKAVAVLGSTTPTNRTR